MTDQHPLDTSDKPWPARRRTAGIVAAVLLALLGTCGLALGVASASTDGRVGLLLVGSPLLLVAAALVYLSRARRLGTAGLRVREVGEPGQRGVVLPYSTALGVGYVVTGAYCLLFFGVIATGGLMSGGLAAGPRGVALIVMALLVCAYLLWCIVDLARGALRLGWVALTPGGIHHRSWAMRSYLPWADVVAVVSAEVKGERLVQVMAAANTTGWVRRTSSVWRQGELAFAPHLSVHGRYLGADAELLYRAVRFYHENPGTRDELGSEAALRRLANL